MTDEATELEQARIELATQFRRGMHLTVGRDPDATQLRALASTLARHLDEIELAPPRVRGQTPWHGPDAVTAPRDGESHHGDQLVTTATGLFIDATDAMAKLYGA